MRPTPSFSALPITSNTDVEATINGWRWLFPSSGDRTIGWSVSGSQWNHPTLQSSATQDNLREVFNNVGYYIEPDFQFLGYFTSTTGKPGYQLAYESGADMNITFAYNGVDSAGRVTNDNRFTTTGQTAFCNFPSARADVTEYAGAAGDTWMNYNNAFIASLTFEVGSNGFALLLHEVLHGMGLKHPHDDGGSGRPTYADLEIAFVDRQWLSVMSYDRLENGGDGAYQGSMPIAPMLMDVIALQYLYGESSGSAGDSSHDLSIYSGAYYNTLWDHSGTDTLDASRVPHGLYIEMELGEAFNGSRTHQAGYITTALDKLSLAVLGYNPVNWTWLWGEFENVDGSAFADIVIGNSLDNDLNGDDGNDHLYGGDGDDRFDWDPQQRGGDDTFEGGYGDDVYVIDSRADTVVERSGEGLDTVWTPFDFSLDGSTLENVRAFSTQTTPVTLTGNSWANTLSGGAGADRLLGREGDDHVEGMAGNDIIDGGSGIDVAEFHANRSQSTVRKSGSSLQVSTAADHTDSLTGVERLQFNEISLAFDLGGNAGTAARVLGAVFGRQSVANESWVGIVLDLLDDGIGTETLMQAALDVRLGIRANPAAVVDLLYFNLAGFLPSTADRNALVQLINNHTFTPATLGIAAAQTELNAVNIGLAGLYDNGLEYLPGA